MVNTDSVSVFAEGTFEEQIRELVEYIARTKPESERTAFKQPFADVLKTAEGQKSFEEDSERKQQVVLQVVAALDNLGEGSDREIEGFFNLIFSHLSTAYAPDSPEFLKSIVDVLGPILKHTSAEQSSVKYKVLANLFNSIPRTSPARLVVCKALLKLAVENDELETLQLSPTDVDRWLIEWSASPDEKSDFLKAVAESFSAAGRPDTAYTFFVSYVRSLSPSTSADYASLQLIASALRLPTIFDFDSLLKLENVRALSSHGLFDLLQIFNKQGLTEFKGWQENNQSTLDEYKLDASKLEQKIRLLILSELGFSKIGQNVSYAEIASALQIEQSEVEKWVIDVIRAGLLSGKLSQTSQSLLVVRASPRGFAAEQWVTLEQRLLSWKEGIAGIKNVLSAARQSMGTVPVGSGIAQEQSA
ncbi:PCI-domain-containing protein [Phellopilus nigrolimitatus]|nr:PCI-domain-containing protein [Phellopilus nigrolimitatus]